MIEKNFTIRVGDANGADKAVGALRDSHGDNNKQDRIREAVDVPRDGMSKPEDPMAPKVGPGMTPTALVVVSIALFANQAFGQNAPMTTCDRAGIGSSRLTTNGPTPTIVDVATGHAGSGPTATPYCLVKVLVPEAINIWVGLPMDGKWDGICSQSAAAVTSASFHAD